MYISKGNIKLKCNIFDLPSELTCKCNLECSKYCYAKKAERIYPNVLPCRKNNLKQSRENNFVEKMINILQKRKNNFIRIHSSGDFYNRSYVLKLYKIIKSLPDKIFYAYTKRDDIFTKDLLENKPKNLTLILSLDGIKQGNIDNLKVPYGFDKIAITHKDKNNCPANHKDIICMVNCKKCIDKKTKKIIFKKH